MRQFLYCEAGYVEKDQWLPNSWVNVECPTPEDLQFLMDRFNVPESFLSDIADTDERPRIEYEGNWLLTILRIPLQNQDHDIPFNTVPIGIITNNEIIVSVCYHKTDLIPETNQLRRHRGGKGVREKHPQRGSASVDEAGEKHGILQHLHPRE